MAGGHVLLEDVPGVGKTTLAGVLAKAVFCSFGRIQFTPDTPPGAVSGVSIYNMKTGEFEYRAGCCGCRYGKGSGIRRIRILTVFGYAMLAVFLTGSIVLILQRTARNVYYRRMDVTGKFRMEIAANLRVLGFLNLHRREGETLQEFRERVVQKAISWKERGEKDCLGRRCDLQCITDYEEILYGEKAAEPEMLEKTVE